MRSNGKKYFTKERGFGAKNVCVRSSRWWVFHKETIAMNGLFLCAPPCSFS